jgi:hypothetical protein
MTYTVTDTDDHPATLDGVIYEALGAASVCWEDMTGTGEFQERRAREIGEAVLEYIRTHIAHRPVLRCDDAHLGLATTRELLDELTSRIEVDYHSGGGGLDYTTVAGRPGGEATVVVEGSASFATYGAITGAIVDFDWGDYGLDVVDPHDRYAEWVPDLARAIAGACSSRPMPGDRFVNGNQPGVLTRCHTCAGDGTLHVPDPQQRMLAVEAS